MYMIIFFFRYSVSIFFCIGPQYAILGTTGTLGQIASFERFLRGSATTPFAPPYPFRTSTWTRIDAERDKREVRSVLCFGRYSPELFLDLARLWC